MIYNTGIIFSWISFVLLVILFFNKKEIYTEILVRLNLFVQVFFVFLRLLVFARSVFERVLDFRSSESFFPSGFLICRFPPYVSWSKSFVIVELYTLNKDLLSKKITFTKGICTRYLNSGKFMIDKCKEEKSEKKRRFSIKNSILMHKFMKIS